MELGFLRDKGLWWGRGKGIAVGAGSSGSRERETRMTRGTESSNIHPLARLHLPDRPKERHQLTCSNAKAHEGQSQSTTVHVWNVLTNMYASRAAPPTPTARATSSPRYTQLSSRGTPEICWMTLIGVAGRGRLRRPPLLLLRP